MIRSARRPFHWTPTRLGNAGDLRSRHRQGQVILEFVISLGGLVVLTYICLSVWIWLNRMLAERQDVFQRTRLDAGKVATAGMPVDYTRPLLRLIGPPGSDAGGPGSDGPGGLPILEAPCDAAIPYIEAAKLRQGEFLFINAKLEFLSARVEVIGNRIKTVASQLPQACVKHPESLCPLLQRSLSMKKKRLKCILQNEIPPLIARLMQLHQEIQALILQGTQACQGVDVGPIPPYDPPPFSENVLNPPCPAAAADYQQAKSLLEQVDDLIQQRNEALSRDDRHAARDLFTQAREVLDQAEEAITRGDLACNMPSLEDEDSPCS